MNYYKNNSNINTNNNHNNTLSRKKPIENVLVLQGGGSLGAFACGVFKALYKKNIKFDIVSGTSIGAINGAIIVGVKVIIRFRIWKIFGWSLLKVVIILFQI